MIQRIPNWTWVPGRGGITMAPPAGGVTIRYRERLRPLQSVAAILRDRAADTRFRVTNLGPVQPLVTNEGEHAAIVDIAGVLEAPPGGGPPQPLARSLGFIFGDDWYSEVAGVATRPELAASMSDWVRRLVTDSQLMLGVRRRRYDYTPPATWHGYTRLPLFMTWFPPDHPRIPTSITVYPALPIAAPVDEAPHFGMLRIGPPSTAELVAEAAPAAGIRTGSLAGQRWELSVRDEQGRSMQRTMILLRDERYLYTTYLDRDAATATDSDPELRAYAELVTSIQPVPTPRRDAPFSLVPELF